MRDQYGQSVTDDLLTRETYLEMLVWDGVEKWGKWAAGYEDGSLRQMHAEIIVACAVRELLTDEAAPCPHQ